MFVYLLIFFYVFVLLNSYSFFSIANINDRCNCFFTPVYLQGRPKAFLSLNIGLTFMETFNFNLFHSSRNEMSDRHPLDSLHSWQLICKYNICIVQYPSNE